MSKLKVVILATMFVWSGFELRQTAASAQSSATVMTQTSHPRIVFTDTRSFALAKACTLRRYRRPR